MTTTTQPIDGEIDLRELGEALKRRWRWIVGCTLSGMAVGGVVALMQPAQAELSMFVDLSRGPQTPSAVELSMFVDLSRGPEKLSAAWLDKANLPGPSLVATYSPKYEQPTVVLLVKSLVASGKATPEQQKLIKTAEPAEKILKSKLIVEVTAKVPSAQATNYLELFQDLEKDLLRNSEKYLLPVDIPAQSDFVTIQDLEYYAPDRSALAFGGLAGLVVGGGAGVLADRRANRVFSATHLQQILGYPVLAVLPSQPWDDLQAQAEIAQLSQQLDLRLHWRILSIVNHHACIDELVKTLSKLVPSLKCSSYPPLLVNYPPSFSAKPSGGILLVVEKGFNSKFALEQAARVLSQLSGLERVGLVMIDNARLTELDIIEV